MPINNSRRHLEPFRFLCLLLAIAVSPVLQAQNADSLFPTVSGCQKNWSDADTYDVQSERIEQYKNCMDRAADRLLSDAQTALAEFSAKTQVFKNMPEIQALDVPSISAVNETTDDALNALTEAAKAVAASKDADDKRKKAEEKKKLLGWNWGAGVGASFGLEGDRISDAEIQNGVVRVKKDVTNTPRLVLEIHNFIGELEVGKREGGHGPFAAVNFGAADGNTLTAFGLGWMWGVKHAERDGSFNIGLGLMLDQNVKVLGDGFTENAPPPPMETEVRFKEESQLSAVVFFSTTF